MLLAVELAYWVKVAKVLPRAGGILDQDYRHVLLIKAGLEAFAKKEERDNKPKGH